MAYTNHLAFSQKDFQMVELMAINFEPAKTYDKYKRFIPVFIIFILLLAAYVSGLTKYISYEQLQLHYRELKQLARAHPIAAPIAYILLYITITAISIPGAIYVTLLGGFIFPQPFCTIYAVFGATTGAFIVYSAAHYALGDTPCAGVNSYLEKMEHKFKENTASYLLFLRLVPIFPFWLVNLASACIGVPVFTFIWTTFIGIIPATFVFTQAGAGLGSILETDKTLSVSNILNTQVMIALVGLGILALFPVVIKKIMKIEGD